jgi:hypothetical protein
MWEMREIIFAIVISNVRFNCQNFEYFQYFFRKLHRKIPASPTPQKNSKLNQNEIEKTPAHC